MRQSALTLGLCLVSACIASANTINSNTIAFDLLTNGGAGAANPLDGNLNDAGLNQFDPALGTLTGVTLMGGINLIIVTEASLGPQAQNGDSILGDFILNGFYTLPGGLANEFDTVGGTDGCTAVGSDEFASCAQQQTYTMPQAVIPNATSPILTAYIGTSSVLLQLQSIGTVSLDPSSPVFANFSDNLFFESTEFTGNLFLQYTYDPAGASTPEPGSIALIGGGLVLIGLLSKRGRRRRPGTQEAPEIPGFSSK
jgi:hypothetical protein